MEMPQKVEKMHETVTTLYFNWAPPQGRVDYNGKIPQLEERT